jgi:hypothetical protein
MQTRRNKTGAKGKNMMFKRFAVVRHWEDNPTNFQVLDYFATVEDAQAFVSSQPKSKDYKDEIRKYE